MNEQYKAYLESPAWKAKRRAVKKRCNNICERCHRFLVDDVHHLTYAHVYDELLEELQGLCRPCHSFLHGDSGIDPLQESIRVKVSWKIIEYLDFKSKKYRRINIAKKVADKFRWGRVCTTNETFVLDSQVGEYDVPMGEFFDQEGNPIIDPAKWRKYRVAYRIGKHWMQYGKRGRPVQRDASLVKKEIAQREQKKESEEKRLRDKPESFTTFQDNVPKTPLEVRRLFKRFPRIVSLGRDCTILDVRETRTKGVALSLRCDIPNGGWLRFKIYNAEEMLASGQIVLDHERSTWVVKAREGF